MSEVLEPQYVPIEVSIDVDAWKAEVTVPGMVESKGTPITNPFTGGPFRGHINLPDGFEYTVAEVGNGSTRTQAGRTLNLSDSYGQFNILRMNQDGVIRD